MEQINNERKYTYIDYLTWSDGERWELIDGVAYSMAPAPDTNHQKLSFKLSTLLGNFLEGKPYHGFAAPIDVRFENTETTDTIVQPDLVVVCEEDKITPHGITGAPNLVIEILSPSTALRDCMTKRALYERHGVHEYWIISPQEKLITQCLLVDGRYVERDWNEGELQSVALIGFSIDLSNLFAAIA